jgi:N-acetyl-anhydromuramyl-L-alanine amidase AmpD
MSYVRTDHSRDCDPRVHGTRTINPSGCLIHSTMGVNSLSWLLGGSADAGSPASADALIDRNGTQHILTRANWYAYHAGNSYLYHAGAYFGNDVSQVLLGIELECTADQTPTFEQYDSLANLIVQYAHVWDWRWPFVILGHYAVARPLGRRSDPTNFDWGSFMGRLYYWSLEGDVGGLEVP